MENKNNTFSNHFFSTSNLALATTLALFVPISSIKKDTSRKANFIFQSSSELRGLIDGYWEGSLRVNPQEYFNQLRIIKSRLYE